MSNFKSKSGELSDSASDNEEQQSYVGQPPAITVSRGSTNSAYSRETMHFLYCLVFPTEHKKMDLESLAAERQRVLDRIVDAGLNVELFFSVNRKDIFCKVSANDRRLLQEADAQGYNLDLDPAGLRTVAEGDLDEERGPIYLVSPFNTNERFEKLLDASDPDNPHWGRMSAEEVEPFMLRQTKLSPFEQMHAKYSAEWENDAHKRYNVQIYRTYADGAILRTADRMKLIKLILETRAIRNQRLNTRGAGLELSSLVYRKHLRAAFPLNAVTTSSDTHELSIEELYALWYGKGQSRVEWLPWRQPINEIRNYFGEMISLYFAFLGHYTLWLLAPAFFGLIVFGFQLANVKKHTDSYNFLTATTVEITVDALTNITTREAKVYTEIQLVPVYALFVSVWATIFIEFWKRKQSRLALRWGMIGFEADETARVEFTPTHMLPSPITGKPEEFYSRFSFTVKLIGSAMVLGFAISLVVAVIAAILVFKVAIQASTAVPEEAAPQVALVLNALLIQVMAFIYRGVARTLNDWENHRTDTQYEDNLIVKTFVFNTVNSYGTLFYFAFIKSGSKILGETQFCAPFGYKGDIPENETVLDSCYGGLGYSLLIVFAVQLTSSNLIEVLLPLLSGMYTRYTNLKVTKGAFKAGSKVVGAVEDVSNTTLATLGQGLKLFGIDVSNKSNRLEDSDKSLLSNEGKLQKDISKVRTKSPTEDQFYLQTYESTFFDWLEIAIQFGYTTLFVAAFPLAPLLAVINNTLEVRLDSYKLCKLSRRPEMRGAEDIGTWEKIFTTLGLFAVVSNAAVICFTSRTFVSDNDIRLFFLIEEDATTFNDVSSVRVWMFNLFLAVVLSTKWVIGYWVPDIPEEVTIQVKRNEYLVRKCFLKERDESRSGNNGDDNESTDSSGKFVRNPVSQRRLEIQIGMGRSGQSQYALGDDPRYQHTVHMSDPAIEAILMSTAKEIRKQARMSNDPMAFAQDFDRVFRVADTNDSGSLSLKEFSKVLNDCGGGLGEKLSENEIDMLVSALDTNANGRIDYIEFAQFLNASTGVTLPAPQEEHEEGEEEEGEEANNKVDHRRTSKQHIELGEKHRPSIDDNRRSKNRTKKWSDRRMTKESAERELEYVSGSDDEATSSGSVRVDVE